MPNRSYNNSANPAFNSAGSSQIIRNEFQTIAAGFAVIENELDTKGTLVRAGEWIDPGYITAFVTTTKFTISDSDERLLMVPNRRLRLTIGGVYYYSDIVASVYGGGTTTVTIMNAVLTNDLTLVEYSAITPYSDPTCSLSLANLQSIITIQTAAISAAVVALASIVTSLVPIAVDTSAGNIAITLPPTLTHAGYVKTTPDANVATFVPSSGDTIAESGLRLDALYSSIAFDKIGTVWYRRQN